MNTPPNPIVVRVFAKGGVDFVTLNQAVTHDLKCLMENRRADIPAIAGVFNNSFEAANYIPVIKRKLREAREKRAVEAAAAIACADSLGVRCEQCGRPVESMLRGQYVVKLCYACMPPPAPINNRPYSGDRNDAAGNVPAAGNDLLKGTSNFEESSPMVRP